jgi:hypothetical protein
MIRWASPIAVAGALIQIGYGVLACVFGYPAISDRPFEALWALANVGMIANIAVWLSIKVATPRLALIGGGLAILGHLIRVAISLVTEARPDASIDTPVVITIMLVFTGPRPARHRHRPGTYPDRRTRVGTTDRAGWRPGRRAVLLLRQGRALHPARPAVGCNVDAYGTRRLPLRHRAHRRPAGADPA